MDNPYYSVAEKIKGNSRKIWKIIFLSLAVTVLFISLGYIFEGVEKLDNGKSIFGLLAYISFIPTSLVILFLFPVSETFTRLDNERGVYKNHKLQEWVYSIVYTTVIIFFISFMLFLVIGGFLRFIK